MNEINKSDYPNCKFGENIKITGEKIVIKDGAVIGNNIELIAKNIEIGFDSVIQDNAKIRALEGIMSEFKVGDNSLIGFNTQILTTSFKMLDYSQIHNNCLLSGYKPLVIGHNCWIGQYAILNSFENLTIKNNVRMGGCQIWTHVASGELLEGCNFFGSAPVTIEDNVWLMGFGHLVTPGVILNRNSIIMAGSVVTKSTEAFHTYSGIPAKDVTDKLNGWRKITIDEKFNLLKDFINNFLNKFPEYENQIYLFEDNNDLTLISQLNDPNGKLIFFKKHDNIKSLDNSNASYFDLNSKYYTKRRSKIEISWMKFSVGYRARFIPI